MDYKTKPTSRRDLRRYAEYFRKLFDVPPNGPFPVLLALDKIRDIFQGCDYIILDDSHFSPRTMARCVPNAEGGFTIEIKDSIYRGAHKKKIGAYLGFICHEICHIFLFKIGFTPVYERTFEENELPPYVSVEWQTKALCGEVMIPYEESRGMTIADIQSIYHVSKGFACTRKRLERGEAIACGKK